MTFLPVVTREMSVLARRKSTYLARVLMTFAGVLVMGWMLLAAGAVPTLSVGRTVFTTLTAVGFFFALFGAIITADSVSEEKREGTLGLLFLTDLKGYDIILGKLAATSLSAAFAMLGLMPVMSLGILLGGVTFGQVGQSVLVLGTALFLSLSVGVLVSTLSENERKALVAAFVSLFILTFVPFLIAILGAWGGYFSALPGWLLFVSPFYAFQCVYASGASAFDISYFWASLAFQVVLSILCLAAAALILPRFINAAPGTRMTRLRQWVHRLSFGDPIKRHQYRAELLDRNAFLWLASRERTKPRFAWLVLALVGAPYFWALWFFPELVGEPYVALALIFLVHFIFKIWTASEVSSRLIQDRRSGAFELLLSSPLSVRAIAHGQTLALRRIFLKPVFVLIAAELFLMFAILRERRSSVPDREVWLGFGAAITTLLLDLWALKWVGVWLSLRGKSIERVMIGTIARVMFLPWVLFFMALTVITAARIAFGIRFDDAWLLATWWIISVVPVLVFALWARFMFFRNFREAAAQPFSSVPAAEAVVRPESSRAILKASRRRWPRPGWALALALLFGVPLARRYYWEHRIESEVRAIAAEGLPTGLKDLGLFYAPVPVQENAIASIRAAGALNTATYGRRLNQTNARRDFGTRLPPPVLSNYAAVVALNKKQLAAFSAATKLPKAHLPPVPISEGMWAMPNDLQDFATVAMMDAVLAVEEGRSSDALARILDLLRFARILREQPVSEAHWACVAALERATESLEYLMRRRPLDDAALDRLEQAVVAIDAAAGNGATLRRSLIVRRALVLERMRQPGTDRFTAASPVLAAINGFLSGIGSRARGYYLLLASYRAGLALVDVEPPERLNRAGQLDRGSNRGWLDVPSYFRAAFEMNTTFQVDAALLARTRVMRTALKTARTGELPGTLAGDPFTGEPLKVSRVRGELRIYSFGLNHRDNHGSHGGDIVFTLFSDDTEEAAPETQPPIFQ